MDPIGSEDGSSRTVDCHQQSSSSCLATGVAHSAHLARAPSGPYGPGRSGSRHGPRGHGSSRVAPSQPGRTTSAFLSNQVSPLDGRTKIRVANNNGTTTTTTATTDTLKSMALSRGAFALGVAVALGELARSDLVNDKDDDGSDVIGKNWQLYSSKASTSGGVELLHHEVVMLGMSDNSTTTNNNNPRDSNGNTTVWKGPLAVDHAVMQDSIDVQPVPEALQRLGVSLEAAAIERPQQQQQQPPRQAPRLVCLLAKRQGRGQSFGPNPWPTTHTMLDDSDIGATRHARAFVAGILAGLVGHTQLFVSGGAEHQGPDGGGPVAVIVDRSCGVSEGCA